MAIIYDNVDAFSALTLLVGREEEHPVCKNCDDVLVWLSVWCEVHIVCGPADATASQYLITSCLI